jgi:hypothetical protein
MCVCVCVCVCVMVKRDYFQLISNANINKYEQAEAI